MSSENDDQIAALLEAVAADWALCDEKDEDDFMVLVNADRDAHESLKPLKSLVNGLEADGYIRLDAGRSDPKDRRREYLDFLDEKVPVAFVYFYEVTDKGEKWLAELDAS